MRSFYCDCFWRIVFRGWYRVGKIGICDNSYGVSTGWYISPITAIPYNLNADSPVIEKIPLAIISRRAR